METEGKLETAVPFEGFYETMAYSKVCEACHDEECPDMDKDCMEESCPHNLPSANMKKYTLEYAKRYTELFAKALGITLELKELVCPRYYNYSTDRIFAYISVMDAALLLEKVDVAEFRAMVKDRHSSREGFWSWVESDFDKWTPIQDWDEFQLETLLEYHWLTGDRTPADWRTRSCDRIIFMHEDIEL